MLDIAQLNVKGVRAASLRRNTKPKGRNMANKRPDPLNLHIKDFASFSAAMMVLGEMAPLRMTLSQAIFFVTAATAILAGKQPTYTDIQEAIGDTVNRNLSTTYRILLEPSRVYPQALRWMSRETNPADNRERFFNLTPRGREVMEQILEALHP